MLRTDLTFMALLAGIWLLACSTGPQAPLQQQVAAGCETVDAPAENDEISFRVSYATGVVLQAREEARRSVNEPEESSAELSEPGLLEPDRSEWSDERKQLDDSVRAFLASPNIMHKQFEIAENMHNVLETPVVREKLEGFSALIDRVQGYADETMSGQRQHADQNIPSGVEAWAAFRIGQLVLHLRSGQKKRTEAR